MVSKNKIQLLVDQGLVILKTLGVPIENLTERRKEKMTKAFLAIAGLKPGMSWSQAQDNDDKRQLLSRQIIAFMNAHLGEDIADSSYDDIRRKDLVLPEAASIILKSAKNHDANTNDGTRGFALNPAAAMAIRNYGTPQWQSSVEEFMKGRVALSEELNRKRSLARIPVLINSETALTFSPGKHNILQKQVIESFLTIFGFGATVLYVGDTADKDLFIDQAKLDDLKFFKISHDKLPDVIAFSAEKNWLYLIEAVTTANPITELRRRTLLQLTAGCTADVIFITAFPDRLTYRKFAKEIAWETEVWIADSPEHMIHFNGDKFLGPYK